MRWIYREFFYVPKYAKVSDKVMNAHILLTVVIIVISIAAMSLSAYAYFSYNVSSGSNQMQAASFDTSVSIVETGGESIPVSQGANSTKQAVLPAGTYQITIQAEGTASTGFCIIKLQDCDTTYHTRQLEPLDAQRSIFAFLMTITGETTVSVTPNWGTSSYYAEYIASGENTESYILDGDTVVPSLPAVQPPETPQTPTEQTTEPPETEPPATEPEATEETTEATV